MLTLTLSTGIDGVKLDSLTKIVLSWVTSPLMGGVVSYTIFYTIHTFILTSKHKVQAAKVVVPYYVALTIGVCVAFLLMNGPAAFRLEYVSLFSLTPLIPPLHFLILCQ